MYSHLPILAPMVAVVTELIFRVAHFLQVSARSKSRHGHSTCARPFPVPKKSKPASTRAPKNNGALRGVRRPCRSRVSPHPHSVSDHSPPLRSSTLGTMSYSIDDAWGPQPFLSPPAPLLNSSPPPARRQPEETTTTATTAPTRPPLPPRPRPLPPPLLPPTSTTSSSPSCASSASRASGRRTPSSPCPRCTAPSSSSTSTACRRRPLVLLLLLRAPPLTRRRRARVLVHPLPAQQRDEDERRHHAAQLGLQARGHAGVPVAAEARQRRLVHVHVHRRLVRPLAAPLHEAHEHGRLGAQRARARLLRDAAHADERARVVRPRADPLPRRRRDAPHRRPLRPRVRAEREVVAQRAVDVQLVLVHRRREEDGHAHGDEARVRDGHARRRRGRSGAPRAASGWCRCTQSRRARARAAARRSSPRSARRRAAPGPRASAARRRARGRTPPTACSRRGWG